MGNISRLDTMVTVVDAAGFLLDYNAAEELQNRGESLSEEDERTVTDLLVDQVEFADVIVLNKLDLVSNEDALEVEAVLRALNPGAKIHRTTHGRISLDCVLDTGLFDYEKAERSAGWIQETEEYYRVIGPFEHTTTRLRRRSMVSRVLAIVIRRFIGRASAPFDADKLWAFLNDEASWRGVLRSNNFLILGFLRHSGRRADHRIAYEWAQAGGVNNLDAAGNWIGPLPHVKNGITLTVNGRTSNRDGIRATAIVMCKHWFLSVNTWTKRASHNYTALAGGFDSASLGPF